MIKGTKTLPMSKKLLKKLPQAPGVYIFSDKKGTLLYIGKAKNLKLRVSSYFLKQTSGKTKTMVGEAANISYIVVNSELEALLLEAKLVNKNQPKYNTELKDDKHPLYIRISKEKYPRILTARKIEQKGSNLAFYGPFPAAANVYSVLRMLKRILPFSNHPLRKRACLHSQIGLCNPCPSMIESHENSEDKKLLRKKYLSNIKLIKGVLDGRIVAVKKKLQKNMHGFSNQKLYEEAAILRDQLKRLEYITQPISSIDSYLKNPNFIEDIRQKEADSLMALLKSHGLQLNELRRIECFDVAHTAGNLPTASMVTFVDGQADKRLYRHFRIRQKKTNSDTDSMMEIVRRRKGRFSDWGRPDLILVDGGKPQVSAFFEVLKDDDIPVIGLAKRYESIVIPKEVDGKRMYEKFVVPRGSALHLIQRLRDEAHRFARRYHHKLVEKTLKESIA